MVPKLPIVRRGFFLFIHCLGHFFKIIKIFLVLGFLENTKLLKARKWLSPLHFGQFWKAFFKSLLIYVMIFMVKVSKVALSCARAY